MLRTIKVIRFSGNSLKTDTLPVACNKVDFVVLSSYIIKVVTSATKEPVFSSSLLGFQDYFATKDLAFSCYFLVFVT